jgi:hypothetical protein
MPKARKRKKPSGNINTAHLVLSTGEAHPPFIQEISPGVIEKCVWDDSINGYRCRIIQESNG